MFTLMQRRSEGLTTPVTEQELSMVLGREVQGAHELDDVCIDVELLNCMTRMEQCKRGFAALGRFEYVDAKGFDHNNLIKFEFYSAKWFNL